MLAATMKVLGQLRHPELLVVDSHTAGEPTRVVIEGIPALKGSMLEKRQQLEEEFDWIRSSTVREPRGFEAMVGAVLTEPSEPDCVSGMVFYNHAGFLGMCIHGTIGVVKTLQYLGKISEGSHKLDTPVGVVTATIHADQSVSVENVVSYLYQKEVKVSVPNYGDVVGDIVWGGNWFFLVNEQGPPVTFSEVTDLTQFSLAIMEALETAGIKCEDGGKVDHVELFGPPENGIGQSKNFVMCPGGEYDRSPCGTGTSAKLACLYDKGQLKEGENWVQASILNTTFSGSVKACSPDSNKVIPTVSGKAWITGESKVLIQQDDPFGEGIC